MGDEHVDAPGVLSPSQIETFLDCERKWAFIYISGIRPESGGAAALGGKVHKQLEQYLKGEAASLNFTEPGGVGDIASLLLAHLPPPKTPGMRIEGAFKFQSPSTGIFYRGFKDVVLSPPEFELTILDHKTTSNIAAWAKSAEKLKTDTQAIIYAQHELSRWLDVPHVKLQWNYAQTKGPKRSLPVVVTLDRQHVADEFAKIEVDGQRILATLKARPDPLSLPPTPTSCEKYGGCPYRYKCNLSPEQSLESLFPGDMNMNPSTINFLAGLGTPTPPVEDTVYAPGSEPAAPDAIPARFLTPSVSTMPVSDQPINPPEFQPPPISGQAQMDALTAAAPPEKPKRGRKTKATAEEGTVPLPLPSEESTAPGTPDAKKSEGERTLGGSNVVAKQNGRFTLYIDCMPLGGLYVLPVANLAAHANEDIKMQLSVPEWRIGEPVAFGRAAGFLSARVLELAMEKNVDLLLDSTSTEGSVCRSALTAAAGLVVVGLR